MAIFPQTQPSYKMHIRHAVDLNRSPAERKYITYIYIITMTL